MAATTVLVEDPPPAAAASDLFVIDEAYEFSAPRFYDFIVGETDEEARAAEIWFENACSYAPSPFMLRIKATRAVQTQTLCNFEENEQVQKATDSSENEQTALNAVQDSAQKSLSQTISTEKVISVESTEEKAYIASTERKENMATNISKKISEVEMAPDAITCTKESEHVVEGKATASSSAVPTTLVQGTEASFTTPPPERRTENKRRETAKKIASLLKNPSALHSKNRFRKSQVKGTKPANVKSTVSDTNVGNPNLAQENRAIKRQKLEGGMSRQIHTVHKPSNLPHKTKTGIVRHSSNFGSFNASTCKEDRKIYVREPAAAPFVSMAEMTRKFQTSTRDLPLPRNSLISQSDAIPILQTKHKLTLTRPKTPEFETSQRMRPVKIKSSAELEEEMMAKIPKFKARPINKKIFHAPTLPPLPRSAPQLPEFKEFHLETTTRANQHAETSSVSSSAQSNESHQWKPHLTAPKPPCLQTSLRARPSRIKSSVELEKEELENIPQFRARPLDKKIFESKGEMGLSCNIKKEVTVPQEFHFAIDKRIPPRTAVVDLFDKLSISTSESFQQEKAIPRNTTPNPFRLYTDERGAEKEKRMGEELLHKQLEEERARVPKALPYPYTTDYPVVPPKPCSKQPTKPEPFQLESLLRHEEEMQREMEEKRRMEMEEARMRIFKAQPILKENPIPILEKPRKPLTEVQGFNLHLNNRAVERAEFDKKIKEKETIYKRYREEAESAKMMEEEKALKQMRRTLVPHARPVPNFNDPFLPQKSGKEATKAKSPKLHVNRRNEKRRRIFTGIASHLR